MPAWRKWLISMLASEEMALRARSQVRWVSAQPVTALTWGKEISGDPFISKVHQYGRLSPDKIILEVGPGYGRLLRSLIKRQLPFSEYFAIELSENNCRYLRKEFPEQKMHFLHANAESVRLPKRFDLMYSSLTFKHLYPSFEQALRNIAKQARPGAVFVFDLLEGEGSYFEEDGVTFIHLYTRQDAQELLARVGLKSIGTDYVEHDPENSERTRLLVIAQKPSLLLRWYLMIRGITNMVARRLQLRANNPRYKLG